MTRRYLQCLPEYKWLASEQTIPIYPCSSIELSMLFDVSICKVSGLEIGRRIERKKLFDMRFGETWEVCSHELVTVFWGFNIGLCEESSIVDGPTHHGGNVGKSILADEIGRCVRQKIAVNYRKPVVSLVASNSSGVGNDLSLQKFTHGNVP